MKPEWAIMTKPQSEEEEEEEEEEEGDDGKFKHVVAHMALSTFIIYYHRNYPTLKDIFLTHIICQVAQ